MDVRQDTSLGDGHASEELVELFVVADGELDQNLKIKLFSGSDVARDYPGALVVLGGVSGELEQLSGEVSNPRGDSTKDLIRARRRGRRELRHQLA